MLERLNKFYISLFVLWNYILFTVTHEEATSENKSEEFVQTEYSRSFQ